MLCRPHSALELPAQLRVASPGTRRPCACLYVHNRVSGLVAAKSSSNLLSLLPGLEKCCGLTPPFDDLAGLMQSSSRRATARARRRPPPLPLGLQKGEGKVVRNRLLLSGFLCTRSSKKEKAPCGGWRALPTKGQPDTKGKRESKVPPKIDHSPTAATGQITKAPAVEKQQRLSGNVFLLNIWFDGADEVRQSQQCVSANAAKCCARFNRAGAILRSDCCRRQR